MGQTGTCHWWLENSGRGLSSIINSIFGRGRPSQCFCSDFKPLTSKIKLPCCITYTLLEKGTKYFQHINRNSERHFNLEDARPMYRPNMEAEHGIQVADFMRSLPSPQSSPPPAATPDCFASTRRSDSSRRYNNHPSCLPECCIVPECPHGSQSKNNVCSGYSLYPET